MIESGIKCLASAVMLQATKDYFAYGANEAKRKTILKELRSNWMIFLTDSVSLVIAERLEKHPEEIKERLKHAKRSIKGGM